MSYVKGRVPGHPQAKLRVVMAGSARAVIIDTNTEAPSGFQAIVAPRSFTVQWLRDDDSVRRAHEIMAQTSAQNRLPQIPVAKEWVVLHGQPRIDVEEEECVRWRLDHVDALEFWLEVVWWNEK